MSEDGNLPKIFTDEFDSILGEGSTFLDLFYKYFVGYSYDIEKIFRGIDLENQKKMLRNSIDELVVFFHSGVLTPYLSGLADKHRLDLEVTPAMYHSFANSLVFSLRDYLPGISKDLIMSWRRV